MIRQLMTAALLTVLGLGTPIASATVIVYTAGLSDDAESPLAPSLATGFAAITLDDVLDTMRVVVSVSPRPDSSTAAHIHCCNAVPWPGAAGTATTLPKFLGFSLGVTSRPYDSILALTLGSEAAGQLESRVYLGKHRNRWRLPALPTWPAGEVCARAQERLGGKTFHDKRCSH